MSYVNFQTSPKPMSAHEAFKIQQENQGVMNRDEGAYQLSHVYDNLLFSIVTSSGGQQIAVRETAAAVETSLKILQSYLRLF